MEGSIRKAVEPFAETVGEPFAILVSIAIAAVIVLVLARALVSRSIARFGGKLAIIIWEKLRNPALVGLMVVVVSALRPLYRFGEQGEALADRVLAIAAIAIIAWALSKVFSIVEALLVDRFRMDESDNLRARKVQTQFTLAKRIGIALIVVVAAATALLTFDAVRQLGATILAGAGVAGVILGLAAQRTLGLLLSGLQVGITQPIRLDDVLIVEGEWGRVEEISLTYVVLRIWDQRRLVVPIDYFLQTPFQNWTRVTSELLGTVFLRVDYTCPLEPLRGELKRLCEAHEKWDGRVAIIQVTEALERAVELRVLVSAADAPSLWDLRCAVREGLLMFIAREYPDHFPRVRAELDSGAVGRSNARPEAEARREPSSSGNEE